MSNCKPSFLLLMSKKYAIIRLTKDVEVYNGKIIFIGR